MSILQAFVQRCYPHACVEMLPYRNAFRVSFEVRTSDLVCARDVTLRKVLDRCTPVFERRKRKLHWGRRNGVHRG